MISFALIGLRNNEFIFIVFVIQSLSFVIWKDTSEENYLKYILTLLYYF